MTKDKSQEKLLGFIFIIQLAYIALGLKANQPLEPNNQHLREENVQ